MANENPNQRPVKRSSWSFVLTFIIIMTVLGLMIFGIFSSLNQPTKFTSSQFVQAAMNGRITEIHVQSYPDQKQIEGLYLEYNKDNPSATSNSKPRTFSILVDQSAWDGAEKVYTVDNESYASDPDPKVLNYVGNLESLSYEYIGFEHIQYVNNPYIQTFWDAWGPTIIFAIITILLAVFMFSAFSKSVGGTNNQALQFNRSRARKETNSKVRFTDVAGAEEEKLEMAELVTYLKEPAKFAKFGAKLPKGVLLVGPPGCGKTLLAKAVAGEAGVPFYSISGSDFVEMFVGVGAGRVRDMFKTAKQNAPCLIFIDEIDAVGRQRGAGLGGGNDEREQTLNQLLVEMDGFSDNSGIIVIAATNRDDVLDPALLRAGRFDRKITVTLPDKQGREDILKVHARNKILDKNVDFSQIAKRTVGFSGADLENVMNEAAILAVRRNADSVSVNDIDEAIDRRISGPAKSSRSMSEHERKCVAYHEAGHAVIGLNMKHSDKVQKITIIPRGNTGGHVLMTPEDDRFLYTKKELIARIVGYLGGRTSEEIFFDDISSGAQNDIEVATRIARMMVTELGMSALGPIQYEKDTGSVFLGRDYNNSQKNFSGQVAQEIDNEIRKIIDYAHDKARAILLEKKNDVILIAETLLEKETITSEEIDVLLRDRKLPNVKEIQVEEQDRTNEELKAKALEEDKKIFD